MLNQVYRLVSERKFETFVTSNKIEKDTVIVHPTFLSICHADQRYYAFRRKAEIINKKLPMALIHEGIGIVAFSNNENFKPGQRVALVPNLPEEKSEIIGENYLETSKFRSSSVDGLMQEYVFSRPDRLVHLDKSIPDNIAAYIEMLSVSNQAVKRLDKVANKKKDIIGVWGDGNLGYMVSAILRIKFPSSKIYVFGHHRSKLNYFSFADKTFLTDSVPKKIRVDHCIEATGGMGSQLAINQAIDLLNPEGSCVLMGVSENAIGINTRMILQKGLTFIGSSRSSKTDFSEVIGMLKENEVLIDEMSILVDKIFNIKTIDDMVEAFEYDENHSLGKTILKWEL